MKLLYKCNEAKMNLFNFLNLLNQWFEFILVIFVLYFSKKSRKQSTNM